MAFIASIFESLMALEAAGTAAAVTEGGAMASGAAAAGGIGDALATSLGHELLTGGLGATGELGLGSSLAVGEAMGATAYPIAAQGAVSQYALPAVTAPEVAGTAAAPTVASTVAPTAPAAPVEPVTTTPYFKPVPLGPTVPEAALSGGTTYSAPSGSMSLGEKFAALPFDKQLQYGLLGGSLGLTALNSLGSKNQSSGRRQPAPYKDRKFDSQMGTYKYIPMYQGYADGGLVTPQAELQNYFSQGIANPNVMTQQQPSAVQDYFNVPKDTYTPPTRPAATEQKWADNRFSNWLYDSMGMYKDLLTGNVKSWFAAEGGLASVDPYLQKKISAIRKRYRSRAEAIADIQNPNSVMAQLGVFSADDPAVVEAFGYTSRQGKKKPVEPQYLAGGGDVGDGMSDSIPATIEGVRPARLSANEYVVPADAVSHLGNGSSDAGAKQLDDMVSRIRKARTGRAKQAPRVNPKKSMPV